MEYIIWRGSWEKKKACNNIQEQGPQCTQEEKQEEKGDRKKNFKTLVCIQPGSASVFFLGLSTSVQFLSCSFWGK